MAKFVTPKDFNFFQHINRELTVNIIETNVILYKISVDHTISNIYGEAEEKIYYSGIELASIITYGTNVNILEQGFTVDQQHEAKFSFVRKLLKEKNVYPEIGDIIYFNDSYWEIDNTTEAQLIANRPEYSQSIVCSAHMTRRSDIQLDERQI